MAEVKVTILVDDIDGANPGYNKDFGFAALIEKSDKRVLFDTGTKPGVLKHNLNAFGLSPESIDAIILSHNHYDHTNGLTAITDNNADLPIYVHRFWRKLVSYQGIGISKMGLMISQRAHEINEVMEGLYLTNTQSSGDYGGIHEHACYVQAQNSYVLICGCCHPGLNKFLSDRSDLDISKESSLHFVGGMHGFRFTDAEAQNLNSRIKSITLCHCTQNVKTFMHQFHGKCQKAVLGKTLTYS